MKMASLWTFPFVLCMCWARSSVLGHNNIVHSESVAMFEVVKKIVNEISDIHNKLETENQKLKNTVLELQ